MQRAIEALEAEIGEIIFNWGFDRDSNEVKELQAAINHLQRKVKKDPRVDGLPITKEGEYSKPLIVWVKGQDSPYIGQYYHGRNSYYKDGVWFLRDKTEDGRVEKTDEILFYADPEEII